MGVRQVEQLRVAVVVGLDQLADVGVARGEGAGKRRANGLVILQCREPCIVGGGRLGIGLGSRGVGAFFIGFLARYRVAGQEVLPALGGGLGQPCIGLLLDHPCPGLGHLLVQVGAVDMGQHLPGGDLGADVLGPVLEVAADPGMDRRLAPGFQVRRQAQGVAQYVGLRLEHQHLGHGGGFGPGGDGLFMPGARRQAADHQ